MHTHTQALATAACPCPFHRRTHFFTHTHTHTHIHTYTQAIASAAANKEARERAGLPPLAEDEEGDLKEKTNLEENDNYIQLTYDNVKYFEQRGCQWKKVGVRVCVCVCVCM